MNACIDGLRMFTFNNFNTEGHFRGQWDFYLLKLLIAFNNGKIKMEPLVKLLTYHNEKHVCPRLRYRHVIA